MTVFLNFKKAPELPCVLLLCDRPVPAIEIVALARSMKKDGRLWPVVVLTNTYVEGNTEDTFFEGLDIVRLYDPAPVSVSIRSVLSGDQGYLGMPVLIGVKIVKRLSAVGREIDRKIRDRLRVFYSWDLHYWRTAIRREIQIAKEVCAKLKPVALVVTDDRSVRDFPGFLHVARERGIFSLLLPYAISDPEADMLRREGQPLFHVDHGSQRRAKQRLIEKFPNQLRAHKTLGRMSFHTPAQTFALAEIDLLSDPSWTPGGGATDVVAVFGEEDRERSVVLGVDRQKILVTGQCSLDAMWRAATKREVLRTNIRSANGLGDDKRIIVCAVPNLGEHNMIPWCEHWNAVEQLFSQLAASGGHVLLSLHPRAERSGYESRAIEAGLIIAVEPLNAILPAADVFVAAMSSTVRWAAMLGVPTVIDDGYGLGYEYFREMPGVHVCEERSELGEVVRRLLKDAKLRKEQARQAKGYATIMGPSDGKASIRVIGTIFDRTSLASSYDTKSR